jgi:hypothetical protein
MGTSLWETKGFMSVKRCLSSVMPNICDFSYVMCPDKNGESLWVGMD